MDVEEATRWIMLLLVPLLVITTPIYATQIGAYNVEINDEYVSGDFRCSCSYGTWYSHIHSEFVNYCPGCHHYGTLQYECHGSGWADYARSDEGMWYCSNCDRDFCGQCGFTHGSYNSGNWLVPYVQKPPENENSIPIEQENKTQKIIDTLNNGKSTIALWY